MLLLLLFAPGHLQAQTARCDPRLVPYALDSGLCRNPAPVEVLAFSGVVQAPEAPLTVRLHFSAYNLGNGSCLLLTSLTDGGQQRLTAKTLPQWSHTSAIFNGDSVLVELYVAPGEADIFARIDQLALPGECGRTSALTAAPSAPQSLCGTDNRVATLDNRVGRINGCTAWLVSNGAVLTAGHCWPLSGVFEVNVPPSGIGGNPVASAPEDQFPIDGASVLTVNNGLGDDYAVFGLWPNSNTGLRAHAMWGFFRLTSENPALNATLRVTGFGVDNSPYGPINSCCAYDSTNACIRPYCNANSRTEQTATGPYLGPNATGTATWHSYLVDTELGNSGSPVIWEANGFALGIHTHGDCTAGSTGENDGTSFRNTGLAAALQSFPGPGAVYVDAVAYPNSPRADGTIFKPCNNLPAAAAAAPSGGRICLVQGSYLKAANTNTFGADRKAMLLVAPVGTVIIGN